MFRCFSFKFFFLRSFSNRLLCYNNNDDNTKWKQIAFITTFSLIRLLPSSSSDYYAKNILSLKIQFYSGLRNIFNCSFWSWANSNERRKYSRKFIQRSFIHSLHSSLSSSSRFFHWIHVFSPSVIEWLFIIWIMKKITKKKKNWFQWKLILSTNWIPT